MTSTQITPAQPTTLPAFHQQQERQAQQLCSEWPSRLDRNIRTLQQFIVAVETNHSTTSVAASPTVPKDIWQALADLQILQQEILMQQQQEQQLLQRLQPPPNNTAKTSEHSHESSTTA